MKKANEQLLAERNSLKEELVSTQNERDYFIGRLENAEKELSKYTCDGAYVSMEFHERKIKELQENYLSDLHRLIQRMR